MNRTLALLLGGLALSSCGDSGGQTTEPEPDTTATVAAPVATVTLSPAELAMVIGDTELLVATTRQQNGTTLTGRVVKWATSDSSVASVSTNGLVKAERVGAATITATSEGKSNIASVTVSAISNVAFALVATGGAHTCALTAAGAAFCWGRGESGQLGVPAPISMCNTDAGPRSCSKIPIAVGGGLTFAQLAGGGAHTCALTSDGSAYCWGDNSSGQLGVNSNASQTAPVRVTTTLKFASIDAGAVHTCALTSSGTAYCWGSNSHGQLGDSTTFLRSVPTLVAGGHIFNAIRAGGFVFGHTCALTTDGAAYCWGDNERGQLGRGGSNVGAQPVPARVNGLTFASLTVGLGRHSCGITISGAAYCWGENTFGALGNGSALDSSFPAAVSAGLGFVQLAAGGFIGHTCGRTSTGAAYCWGENETGSVGDGTTIDRLEPVAVSGGHTYTSLDSGFRHTCGRASTGVVYCWGSNGAGQLGNNANLASAMPVKVVGQQ
ncbi:MAG: Ig-like domain-containing protein [Gemmatimonadota bacterium]